MKDLEQNLLKKPPTLSIEKGSEWSLIFNLCCITCGAGTLSIPYSVYRVGLIPGTLIILLSALVFTYYFKVIIKCCEETKEVTYGLMVKEILGTSWMYFVEVNLNIFIYGLACTFNAIIGGFITDSLYHITTYRFSTSLVVITITVFITSPLCLLREISSFRYLSFLSVICIWYISLVVFFQMPIYLYSNESEIVLYKLNWDFIETFAIILFSFDAVAALPTLFTELCEKEKAFFAVNVSMVISAIYYCLLGIFGYVSLGESMKNVTLITNRHYYWGVDYYMIIGKAAIGCAFIVMLLIVIHLFRTNIQRIAPLEYTNIFWHISTYFCLWSSAWIAILIPKAITYFKFLGGFGVVQTGILVPYLLSMKITKSLTTRIFVSLFTIPLMVVAISAAVKEVIP